MTAQLAETYEAETARPHSRGEPTMVRKAAEHVGRDTAGGERL